MQERNPNENDISSPIPLRAHKKSSNGCRACKERKVKCDERKPVCRKCSVHFSNIKTCDWAPTVKSKRQNLRRQVVTVPPCHQELLCGSDASGENSASDDNFASNASSSSSDESFQVIKKRISCTSKQQCGCPCHDPKYTAILLDAVLGICRICGNYPPSNLHPSHCTQVMPDHILDAGRLDPFSILPERSAPRVHALIQHWIDTLSFFPTEINSQYCTNPRWLSQAIASPVLFHSTLYVSAIHEAGLRGQRQNAECVYYRTQTIKALNAALRDPITALMDETIAAVLLIIHIVSVVGDEGEAATHMKGLQQMIDMRGGICNFTIEGLFLHMLCTTNHLTAVLVESQAALSHSLSHPSSYRPSPSQAPPPKNQCYVDISAFRTPPNLQHAPQARLSPLLRPFALQCGFHATVVDIFDEMGYLYFVLDAFSNSLLRSVRGDFEALMERLDLEERGA